SRLEVARRTQDLRRLPPPAQPVHSRTPARADHPFGCERGFRAVPTPVRLLLDSGPRLHLESPASAVPAFDSPPSNAESFAIGAPVRSPQPSAVAPGLTTWTGDPVRMPRTFSAVTAISRPRASGVAQARCGVMTIRGADNSGLSSDGGSLDRTSTAAPAITPSRKARARSASLTSPPRAVLSKTARRFIV